jgi:beta-galactosidase/beta-glucuronidase
MLSRLARALILIMVLALWYGLSRAAAATRIDLNGEWQFCLDPEKNGEQLGWTAQLPGEAETVRVPHTWSIGRHEDYEGTEQ